MLSKKDIEALEEDLKEEISQAWQEAQAEMKEMGDPIDMCDYVYAERPPYLEEQREAFQQFFTYAVPIQRVTGFDVILPYFAREHAYLPDVARILHGARAVLEA